MDSRRGFNGTGPKLSSSGTERITALQIGSSNSTLHSIEVQHRGECAERRKGRRKKAQRGECQCSCTGKNPFRASTLDQESLPALTSANESTHHPRPLGCIPAAYRQLLECCRPRRLSAWCVLPWISTTCRWPGIFQGLLLPRPCSDRLMISFRSCRSMVVAVKVRVISRTIVRSSLPGLVDPAQTARVHRQSPIHRHAI